MRKGKFKLSLFSVVVFLTIVVVFLTYAAAGGISDTFQAYFEYGISEDIRPEGALEIINYDRMEKARANSFQSKQVIIVLIVILVVMASVVSAYVLSPFVKNLGILAKNVGVIPGKLSKAFNQFSYDRHNSQQQRQYMPPMPHMTPALPESRFNLSTDTDDDINSSSVNTWLEDNVQ